MEKVLTPLSSLDGVLGSEFGVEMEELCGGARVLYLFNEVEHDFCSIELF